MTTRAEVVAEARTWLGTPFGHQQRTKGLAVDCAGLVIGVARNLGLVPACFDVSGYARQPDGASLMRACDEAMTRIAQADLQPGDVVVVAFDRFPGHVGIVGDHLHGGLSIIHALGVTARRVVETQLVFFRSMRFVAAYRLPGIE
jgi:cell wall-associated NlpC family hydrolase